MKEGVILTQAEAENIIVRLRKIEANPDRRVRVFEHSRQIQQLIKKGQRRAEKAARPRTAPVPVEISIFDI